MVNVAPTFEHAPELEKVTALPEPPPVAATVKLEPKAALAGAWVVTLMAWSAGLTVRTSVLLLAENDPSPAKDALTPVGYEPAVIPARLTLLSVATPLPSVVALPALLPLSMNETVLPLTPMLLEVSVAVSVAVPAYVPVIGATSSVVEATPPTSSKQT